MTTLKKYLLLIVLALALPVFAQEDIDTSHFNFQPTVELQIGASSMSYKAPIVNGIVGTETYFSHFVLTDSVGGGLARKSVDPGDGYDFQTRHNFYFRHKSLWVGGGVEHGSEITSAWSKSSTKPNVGFVIDNSLLRTGASYEFRGTDVRNGSRNLIVQLEMKVSRHWSWDQHFGWSWFYETDNPRGYHATGMTFYEGVRWRR